MQAALWSVQELLQPAAEPPPLVQWDWRSIVAGEVSQDSLVAQRTRPPPPAAAQPAAGQPSRQLLLDVTTPAPHFSTGLMFDESSDRAASEDPLYALTAAAGRQAAPTRYAGQQQVMLFDGPHNCMSSVRMLLKLSDSLTASLAGQHLADGKAWVRMTSYYVLQAPQPLSAGAGQVAEADLEEPMLQVSGLSGILSSSALASEEDWLASVSFQVGPSGNLSGSADSVTVALIKQYTCQ